MSASAEYMLITSQVLSFVQYSLAIDKKDVQAIPVGVNWTRPIISSLRNETLPEDHNASYRLKVQLSHFVLIEDVLYKRGFSHPYLRCFIPDEADFVMKEVHKGVCGNHLGAHLLIHKLIQALYY